MNLSRTHIQSHLPKSTTSPDLANSVVVWPKTLKHALMKSSCSSVLDILYTDLF